MVRAACYMPRTKFIILGERRRVIWVNLKTNTDPFQSYAAFFLAKKVTERSHSCTAFPVESFCLQKKVTNLHTIKIRNMFQEVKKVNPNPVTAVQRFGIFQK